MAARSNHFKIGLFVIVVAIAAIVIAIILGASRVGGDTVTFHTYFNESVDGLEVDSPVKFRGVPIGVVSSIRIARDHRHIDVTEKIEASHLARLGFTDHGEPANVPADLRAQLASAGLAGGKIISIDFFDPKSHPAPELPFPTPKRTIPSTPSMLKSLEDTLVRGMDRMPELADAVIASTRRVDRMLAQLEEDGVSEKVAATLTRADRALGRLDTTMRGVQRSGVTDKTARTLDEMGAALRRVNVALDRVDGKDGLLASARRASDVVGDLGAGVGWTARELDQTLREVREAAESIRLLADEIEREPDILLKGRAKRGRSGPP